MPELVFYRRGEEVLRYRLNSERVVLGRGEGCDVVIPDPSVSRAQVALKLSAEALELEDLSGKGTVLCGAVVERAQVIDGADLALGQWRAIYRSTGGGEELEATYARDRQTALSSPQETPPAQQMVQLRFKQAGSESVLRFLRDSITVGTDASCDAVINDPFASGRHVRICRQGALFHLLDLQSTNGTFIGPLRVHEITVPLFTSFKVGEVEISLEPVSPGKSSAGFHGIIGSDPAIRQLSELIERVAPSSAAVAIFGESGTGKELVARAVHVCSSRANRTFIPVNCAAISKELIESELFGHEKGAFTGAMTPRKGAFEEADGGTLFLDEIGELPLELQAKLLRALESGEIKRVGSSRPAQVDVRIVSATNQDLQSAVRQGRFREDLYYRLCVVPLHLPPLRSRKGDLLSLADSFVQMFAPRGQTIRFTPAALERLQNHTWPGNVRELRNVVHRTLLLRKGPMVDVGDLSFDREMDAQTGAEVPAHIPGMTLEQMLAKVEQQIVESALKRYDNNRERVAKELGVGRSTLFKKLKDWGLTQ